MWDSSDPNDQYVALRQCRTDPFKSIYPIQGIDLYTFPRLKLRNKEDLLLVFAQGLRQSSTRRADLAVVIEPLPFLSVETLGLQPRKFERSSNLCGRALPLPGGGKL